MLFKSREILQICKFWTQMILAGNQSKQRGPLRIYLENQDGVRQRQSFLVKYVSSILHDRHRHWRLY